jgi:hypothetical protein
MNEARIAETLEVIHEPFRPFEREAPGLGDST